MASFPTWRDKLNVGLFAAGAANYYFRTRYPRAHHIVKSAAKGAALTAGLSMPPVLRKRARVSASGRRSANVHHARTRTTNTVLAPRGAAVASSTPISQYHENRLLYRKRRMPKRKKRIWKSFKRKVQYISNTQQKKQVMYSKTSFDLTSAVDAQATFDCLMFTGWNGTVSSWYDMLRCATIAQQSTLTTNLCRFYVTSARMNMTYYNAGDKPAYLDLYWFRCNRDCERGAIDIINKNVSTTWQNEASATGTNVTTSTVFGTTPFMVQGIQGYIKIYKVSKHYIAAGQSIEFTIKDPRNHFIKETAIEQNANSVATVVPQTMLKGKTQGVIGCAYGVPSAASGSPGEFASAATIYCRREVQYIFRPIPTGPGVITNN